MKKKKTLTEAPSTRELELDTAKIFAISESSVGFNDASVNENISGLEWDE